MPIDWMVLPQIVLRTPERDDMLHAMNSPNRPAVEPHIEDSRDVGIPSARCEWPSFKRHLNRCTLRGNPDFRLLKAQMNENQSELEAVVRSLQRQIDLLKYENRESKRLYPSFPSPRPLSRGKSIRRSRSWDTLSNDSDAKSGAEASSLRPTSRASTKSSKISRDHSPQSSRDGLKSATKSTKDDEVKNDNTSERPRMSFSDEVS